VAEVRRKIERFAMTTKYIFTILLGVIINSSVRADVVTTPSGHFLKNEPAEKVIWYGGLVAKMIIFYGQACANAESEACFNLATIYETGDASVQSTAKASVYYKQACDANYSLACNNLGILYGEGVERDYAQAAIFFDKACQLKEQSGCKNKMAALDLQEKSKR
jgi:Sel1 repeat